MYWFVISTILFPQNVTHPFFLWCRRKLICWYFSDSLVFIKSSRCAIGASSLCLRSISQLTLVENFQIYFLLLKVVVVRKTQKIFQLDIPGNVLFSLPFPIISTIQYLRHQVTPIFLQDHPFLYFVFVIAIWHVKISFLIYLLATNTFHLLARSRDTQVVNMHSIVWKKSGQTRCWLNET